MTDDKKEKDSAKINPTYDDKIYIEKCRLKMMGYLKR